MPAMLERNSLSAAPEQAPAKLNARPGKVQQRIQTSVTDARAAERRRVYRVVGPAVVLLVLWLWLFYAEGAVRGGPNGKAFGADFAMFIGGAQLLQNGQNPYDHNLLYRTEHSFLQRQHLPILRVKSIVRVGNPPLFFWLLEPLTLPPFQPVALAWILFLFALTAAGFLAILRYLGWRKRAIPLAFFLLSPQVLMGPFYGNTVSIVFFGLCLALVLMRRHPTIAGICLTAAWLKPPIALPIVLMILLFHCPDRRSLLKGFGVSTALLTGVTIAVAGSNAIPQWIHGLLGYSRDIASSPDVVAFSGLYIRSVPHGARLTLEGITIAVALVFTALAWHRYRGQGEVPVRSVGWLWVLWLLCTPYAHFFDEVLIAVPILALMGRDAAWIGRRESVIALYLALSSLLLISAAPYGVQLLWLPLVAVMLCLYVGARSPRPTAPTLVPVRPAASA